MKKIVIENARFNVGASPGFRTLEVTDPDAPAGQGVWLFPMNSLIAAQLARVLMQGDPDPDELAHNGSDSKVVRIGD